jgi:hypothetical protein
MELLRIALTARPCLDGVRRTRFLIARNTYRELKDTTLKTFFQWLPDGVGTMHASDFSFTIRDSGTDAEFLFRSFDDAASARSLLSLELTGVWFNEAREFPRAVFDMASGRVGRYPSKAQGAPAWFGVILDSNPSDRLHWLYRTFAQDRPAGFELFMQPSGLDPAAENIGNLPGGYYERLVAGKADDWVNVYVKGQWGYTQAGRPVFPEFNDRAHVAAEELKARARDLVIVGLDFGLTPAAVLLQPRSSGGYDAVAELTSERSGAAQFGEELGKVLRARFPGAEVRVWGDPAGAQAAQTDEQTVFGILQSVGIDAIPAPGGNVFTTRREAVARLLRTLASDGMPALRISPACVMLRNGLGGGYYYKRVAVSGTDEKLRLQPEKNHYSHVCEALQYAVLGEGEGWDLIGRRFAPADYSTLHRAAI